jgi:phosphopantothenate-cysteine ligase
MSFPNNILITAGGTSEKIDSVRKITNDATGRLGSLIADEFHKKCPASRIFYICGENSACPDLDSAEIFKTGGTDELEKVIRNILTKNKIDVIIHAMAVSDYKIAKVTKAEFIADAFREENKKIEPQYDQNTVYSAREIEFAGKLSSNEANLVLILQPTVKIISLFKKISPYSKIVGFKLLNNVSDEVLIETAYKLLVKNNCDYVLANKSENINNDKHLAFLLNKNRGKIEKYSTKQEIAAGIVEKFI